MDGHYTCRRCGNNNRYVLFDPYCTDEDDEDVEMPPVRYVRPVL